MSYGKKCKNGQIWLELSKRGVIYSWTSTSTNSYLKVTAQNGVATSYVFVALPNISVHAKIQGSKTKNGRVMFRNVKRPKSD